jgi:hypothetical protein
MPMFQNTVCSIFIGREVRSWTGVGKVGYLYGIRFGLKNRLSHSEGNDGVRAGSTRERGCGWQ